MKVKRYEKAKGLSKYFKKFIINQFDSALVGEAYTKEYFQRTFQNLKYLLATMQ